MTKLDKMLAREVPDVSYDEYDDPFYYNSCIRPSLENDQTFSEWKKIEKEYFVEQYLEENNWYPNDDIRELGKTAKEMEEEWIALVKKWTKSKKY